MKIHRELLRRAEEQGILHLGQSEQLWGFLTEATADQPSFRLTHILYYLGGLIAIGAMTLFMNLGWETFGGYGIVGISIGYGVAGLLMTEHCIRRGLIIPAGIVGTFVIALTPLAIYGFQQAMGWWGDDHVYRDYHRYIDWCWIFMELGTLATGAVMLWRYRLPFMVMPVAATLWYMTMDLTPFLFGAEDVTWQLRKLVSMWSGLGVTLLAFWVDMRSKSGKDYAFWLYLFGVMAFWGGLSSQNSDSELSKFIYMCINLGLILIGSVLSRRVFVVFGAFGICGYLGHLSWHVFKDSMLFPFALTLIGLGVIGLGILWQRHEVGLTRRMRAMLPTTFRELLERRV